MLMYTQSFVGILLAFSAILRPASGINSNESYFQDLETFWSYGRSPPVYPSPQMSGIGGWNEYFERASELVGQMTLEEKANLTYGYESINGCSGNTGSVPRLNISGLCFADAAHGVRGLEGVNGYPASLHVGASWNRKLAHERAYHMGAEFKRKGANVVLGPNVGALGRIPKGGRNWEGASNDPYLAGAIVHETVTGIQKSAIACVKHIIGNEQETSRKAAIYVGDGHNHSVSSNIDDQTMHELYLWPFYDAVRAGAGSAMCSYNRVNNSYACQNSKVLNGLLKTELGFQGFVVTDWYEHKSGVASANAGLDLVMPTAPLWNGEEGSLVEMVKNGSVSETRLADMATRVLAAFFKYADFSPGIGFPTDVTKPHEYVEARVPESKPVIFQSAVEGHVLVKNVNNALPLKKPRFLSIFGYDAVVQPHNNPEVGSFPLWKMGFGGAKYFLNGSTFTEDALSMLFGASLEMTETGPQIALNGTLSTGGGSGAAMGNIDAPLDAFRRQAYDDDTFLFWDAQSPAPSVNSASEACLVFINALASESYDRKNLTDDYSDNLILTVADQCNNTMVIVHSAGIRLVDAWIDHPNITAVILAHLPGQDSGRSLVEVMYGKQSPSGRLPYTLAMKEEDYGSDLEPVFPNDLTPYYPQSNFTEGRFIDYKHFLKQNITPRYEFGFGLTYSEFEYSSLEIKITGNVSVLSSAVYANTTMPGGSQSLWDVIATVQCKVTNTGSVDAAEVGQLYVGIPGDDNPEKVLRGFEKTFLTAGESNTFAFPLTRRDLSAWDTNKQDWVLAQGAYQIYVGKSVLDISLNGILNI